MPLYEHVFIARQDISGAQAEGLIEEFSAIITEHGGSVVGHEYWGIRPMAFKINKNRKGHYAFLKLDAPAAAVAEMQRLQRLHDDVMRAESFRVEEHEEGPSAVVVSKNSRDDRRGPGGPRGGRDRDRDGPRGDGPRGDRPERSESKPADAPETPAEE